MRFFWILLFWLAAVPASYAQITNEAAIAYNEAVESGDRDALIQAASVLGEQALTDTGHPDAGAIAFETARRLCLAGVCDERTLAFAEFALASLTEEEMAAAPILLKEHSVLIALIKWRQKSTRKTCNALDSALFKMTPDDVSVMTYSIIQGRILEDFEKGRWKNAADIADFAVTHLAALKGEIAETYASYELTAITSRFHQKRSREQVIRMAHLEGRAKQAYSAVWEEETPGSDWQTDYYWTASAWRLAMEAYLRSTGEDKGLRDEVESILATYELAPIDTDVEEVGDEDTLPFCAGVLKMEPQLRYPHSSVSSGLTGAVIVRFAIEEGSVKDLEVLASVPFDGFREEVSKTVAEWTWEPEEGIDRAACRMSRDNLVLPLSFFIER